MTKSEFKKQHAELLKTYKSLWRKYLKMRWPNAFDNKVLEQKDKAFEIHLKLLKLESLWIKESLK